MAGHQFRLCNVSEHTVMLRRNARVAILSCVEEVTGNLEVTGKSTQSSGEATLMEQAASGSCTMPDIDLQSAGLTLPERKAVEDLLMQNGDVFSQSHLDVGSTTTIEHEIPLSDSTPFRMPYRRIPPSQFQEVRSPVEELKQAGIIKPSQSPFASPIVVVQKKDGKIRLCVDYRRLNSKNSAGCLPSPKDR